MIIVESRQRLVLDATRLERGVERKCPQSALTVQIKRFAVRSPVRRLKYHLVELGDDLGRTGLHVEHVESALLTFSENSIEARHIPPDYASQCARFRGRP